MINAHAVLSFERELTPITVNNNRMLASVSKATAARLLPYLELVHMPVGMVIYEARNKFDQVYFPIDCIISLEYVLIDGNSAKVSAVGNEGFVGISSFLGGSTMPSRAVVYHAGSAYRLPSSCLMEEFHSQRDLLAIILHYTKTLIIQLSQISVCNRYHEVDQQLCRFLLMTLDRVPTTSLNITQEQIAGMLGVRRESITNAAHKLRCLGAITQSRAMITVLDRTLLEKHSCECYEVIKQETDRLIPPG